MASTKLKKALFQKTEPEPEAAPAAAMLEEPTPIPGLEEYVTPITNAAPNVKKKLKPQSVYLNESELKYIQDIANEYGESRHSVMQFAVKELIRQYRAGKKFRTNNLGKLDK